jgi:hypothetical protein
MAYLLLTDQNLQKYYRCNCLRHSGHSKERPVTAAIQVLKKVTLAIIAGSTGSEPGKYKLADLLVHFEFIYGVASVGLCPFENALHDKGVGESIALTVSTSEAHEYFGHLFLPLCQALGFQIMPETMSLKVEVIAVKDAENREVVQSLAKALAHGGCGGSCGCGC